MAKKPKLNDYKTQRQNANAHTARGLGMLANSISQDGWIGGMTVAADGETFDGSARLETLADAMPDAEPIVVHTDGTRPVIVVRDDIPNTDDPRAKRLGIAANRIAQVDYAVDAAVLAELGKEIDLSQFWTGDELAELLPAETGNDAEDPGADVDRAAELQEKWQTEVGQLWQIGRHRMLVGDCTVRENVERLMGGERAGMVFTDPPYGMALEVNRLESAPKQNGRLKRRTYEPVAGDDQPFDFGAVPVPDCAEQFWWGADYYRKTLPDGGSWLVWDKKDEALDGLPGSGFELCWSKVSHKRELVRIVWTGYRSSERNEEISRAHPTQKPVELAVWFIEKYSDSGAVVWDGFCGSGTTLVAAEKTGRIGRGIELSPAYAAVTLERLTGLGLDAHKVD